ncbi:hypothetical protein ODZ73_25725, partial [Escherichia coli]|nr:hypothetical protein [Escherichia coli]
MPTSRKCGIVGGAFKYVAFPLAALCGRLCFIQNEIRHQIDQHLATRKNCISRATSSIFCFPDSLANGILQRNILHFWLTVITVISAFTLYDHNAIICLVDSKQYGAVSDLFTK